MTDRDGLQQTINSPKEELRGRKSSKAAAQNSLCFGQGYFSSITVVPTFTEREKCVVSGNIAARIIL